MLYKDNRTLPSLLTLLMSALMMRVVAFSNTAMINNDGAIYIYQARAIYHGFWHSIGSCTVDYPTVYTILTAGGFHVLGDWVLSAMAVNLIFGTLTIIPLYLLLRRFVDEHSSFLVSFIFAMLPLFAIQSVNIIRDPSYWFFCTLGLYLLVYKDTGKRPFALAFSGLSFVLATATRIEGIVFIIGGFLYAAYVFKGRRLQAVTIFLLPAFVTASSFVIFQVLRQEGDFYWYRFKDIPLIVASAFGKYEKLRHDLTALIAETAHGTTREFLQHSKTLVWFTALGLILNSALEAYFYIFILLVFAGFSGLKERVTQDRRIMPLLIMLFLHLSALYVYCINIWSMENRRLGTIVILTFIFMGFGAEKFIGWFRRKSGLSAFAVTVLLCIFIAAITVSKNVKTREADKLVFKEIGQTIAKIDGGTDEIELITLGGDRLVNFYANLHVTHPPCPDQYGNWRRDKSIVGNNYSEFIQSMRDKKIRYVLWQESVWPKSQFDFLASVREGDLKKIEEWHHRDTKRIILYEVLSSGNSRPGPPAKNKLRKTIE